MPAQSWVANFVNDSQCHYAGKETLPPLLQPSRYRKQGRNLVPMKRVNSMMSVEGFAVQAMEAIIVTRSSRLVCGRPNNSDHSV